MFCERCGKEIPDGENKICDDCKEALKKAINEESNNPNFKEEKKNEKSVNENKSTLFKKLVIVLVIAICVVFILIGVKKSNIVDFDNFFASDNQIGNTISNIRNYGYSAKQGSWIYYVAPADDGTSIAIYKSKTDGSNKKELVKDDWDVLSLNVVNDYIYFIAINNDKIESASKLGSDESVDTLNNVIYRMKLDGTDLQAINSNEFHNNCYEMYVIKDKIYYIGVDTNIYYMDLDGSNKTKFNSDETGYLGFTKDSVILNIKKENNTEKTDEVESSADYETVVMNLETKEVTKLTGNRLYSINVVGKVLYYVDDNKNIWKVNLDGTDNTMISSDVTAYNMNVGDDYIYFMNYTDDSNSKIAIFRADLDGKNVTNIYTLNSYSSFLNVVDNDVIFMDSSENSASIFKISSNGDNRVELYGLNLESENSNLEVDEETNTTEEQPQTTVENTEAKAENSENN